jgi:phage terminase large subunit GpA-like protein
VAAVAALVRDTTKVLSPPPTLTVSEWSDEKRQLSSESSAEPGRWRTSRVPYMRDVMDAVNDPAIEKIVVAKAAQVAYTETINNVLGYFIDQDPAPILIIQPTLDMAETWSKDRLAPMLRDTPALANRVHDPKSRDSGNTIRQKLFPGGRLTVIGANSPSGLASRPIRIVLADEIDRWPISAGGGDGKGAGDPLSLAGTRQTTFWNRKTLLGSTPLHRLTSVVWREFLASDRRRYFVPCPHCDAPQTLRWQNVQWDKGPNGEHMPETAHYVCEHCGAVWDDAERHDAITRGEWKAERPGGKVAGFHIPGFLSPWLTLEEIVRKFLAAKDDPALLQQVVNEVFGEPWEEKADKLDASAFSARGESYSAQSVPDGVLLVTAGVDVQVNRLEVQVVGWGRDEESWIIAYEVIYGDPAQPEIWGELDELLLAPLRSESGRELRIRACCIDVGDTPHAHGALQFCKTRQRRRIFPTKGMAGPRIIFPKRASRTKTNDLIYLIGVDTAKAALYGRLKIDKAGPAYVHFPAGQGFDDEYFAQLTSEQVVTRKREGRPYRVWVPKKAGARNEALDTAVYALAARMSIPIRLSGEVPHIPPPPPVEVDEGIEDIIAATAPQLPASAPAAGTGVRHSQVAGQSWMGGRAGGWWDKR